MPDTFASRLRQARKQATLTVAELAGQVGVTRQTVHGWERGVGEPTITHFFRLAEALRVKLEDLQPQAF